MLHFADAQVYGIPQCRRTAGIDEHQLLTEFGYVVGEIRSHHRTGGKLDEKVFIFAGSIPETGGRRGDHSILKRRSACPAGLTASAHASTLVENDSQSHWSRFTRKGNRRLLDFVFPDLEI